jgi:ribosomal protein S18 acetylase RimI-like enzyme
MSSTSIEPALAGLFGRVWPALPGAIARAEALGFAWTAVSTPFVRREGSRVVGHAGVIELPLVVAGRSCRLGSVHAVCTDPERRGRGLGRALAEEVVAGCAGRFDTLVLTTAIPDFYRPFGFRPVREHAFVRTLPPAPRRSAGAGRVLTGAAEDVRVLRRLLASRAPVSERLGALDGDVVFVIALLLTWGDFSRVHYHAGLDVVTVHEVRDRTLVLYDVVGPAIPTLDVLAGAIGADADRVMTFFVPDRLADGFRAEPWDAARAAAHGDGWFAGLMARGPLEVEGALLMMPPLART